MKNFTKRTIIGAIILLISALAGAQNVGIGTTNPLTKLHVAGALGFVEQNAAAADRVTIPDNVSIFRIINTPGGNATLLSVAVPVEGQLLTIYNEDDNNAAFAGYTIAASGGISYFMYIDGAWQLVSTNPVTGPTGPTGAAGTNGSNGITGATGAAGATGSTGTNGINGTDGTNGTNGTNGSTGVTGAVWITGTVAPTGGQGSINDMYLNTSTGAYYQKTGASTWTSEGNLTGATGAAGAAGATGATGSTGVTGATWITGTVAPTGGQGSINDMYLNTSTGAYYQKTGASTWTSEGNLTGATGAAGAVGAAGASGATGVTGATWITGTVAPTGGQGSINDMYLNTSTGAYYQKTGASTWTSEGNLTGATGAAGAVGAAGATGTTGATWITGTVAPTGGQGSINDMYLNTSTGAYYQKTGASTWTSEGNLTGATGAAGAVGAAGATGATGSTGVTGAVWITGTVAPTGGQGSINDMYLNTSTGAYYQKTGASTWTSEGNLTGATGAAGAVGATGATGPSGSLNAWGLTGNTGTAYSTSGNFLGTTNDEGLLIEVNGNVAGRIEDGTTANGSFFNTSIGYKALGPNTFSENNVALGYQALSTQNFNNSSTAFAGDNTGIGYNSLSTVNTTTTTPSINGARNTAVGSQSLKSLTTGADNTAVGYEAMFAGNSNGGRNNAFGSTALFNNTIGTGNIAEGYSSVYQNTSGNYNVGIGYEALENNVTNNYNTAIGDQSLLNSTGLGNTAVGSFSGHTILGGYYNTFIGDSADASTNALTNATAIGALAQVTASNSMVLGAISGVNASTVNTSVGIGTTAPNQRLEVGGNNQTIRVDGLTSTTANQFATAGTQVLYADNNGDLTVTQPTSPPANGGVFIFNQTTQQTSANFNIQSKSASSVGGIIQGFASQTADLFELKNSSGTTLDLVNSSGDVAINSGTASSSSTTGALVVTGGEGMSGNLNVAGNGTVGGILTFAQLEESVIDTFGIDNHPNNNITIPSAGNALAATTSVVVLTNHNSGATHSINITVNMPNATTIPNGRIIIIRNAADNAGTLIISSYNGTATQLIPTGKSSQSNTASFTSGTGQLGMMFINENGAWYQLW